MATILFNGQPSDSVPVTDRGLHYGDGLFETLAVINGTPRFWQRHFDRLLIGCTRLKIPAPAEELLLQEIATLSQGKGSCVIKLIITRGSGGRGYRPPHPVTPTRLLICYPFPQYPERNSTAGVEIRLCKATLGCNPLLAGIKHLNRLEQVLARSEWDDDMIAEGLMANHEGNIIEGTMSNIFLVCKGELHTPDLSACGIDGVMRGIVIEQARLLDIPLRITNITPTQLGQGSELFLTNSLIGIWPVNRCGEQTYTVGPVVKQLQQALAPLLESTHG